jgi:N-acetyl-anhydromuramyl-L-alanine amidase AmpD
MHAIAPLIVLALGALMAACAPLGPNPTWQPALRREEEMYPGALWRPAAASNYAVGHRNPGDIRWIVIHTTEDTAAKALARFTDPAVKVSTHFIITRAGVVLQTVRASDIAYAAGNMAYNKASISIEFERYGELRINDAQLIAARGLLHWLLQHFPVAPECMADPTFVAPGDPAQGSGIIGHVNVPDLAHSSVGGGENHHTDPVNWDWDRFERILPPTR